MGSAITNITEVILESDGEARASVWDLSRKTLNFYGAISGVGDFLKDQEPLSYSDRTYLYGDCTFKGTVTVKGKNTALYFMANTSPGDRENALVCEGQVRISIQEKPSTYIHSISSTNPNAKIWMLDDCTLEVGESHGFWGAHAKGDAPSTLVLHSVVDGTVSFLSSFTLKLQTCARDAGLLLEYSSACTQATLDLTDYTGDWPLHVEQQKGTSLAVIGGNGGTLRLYGYGEIRSAPDVLVIPAGDAFVVDGTTDAVVTVDTTELSTNWQRKVALWFDASETSTLVPYIVEAYYTNNFPIIQGWGDKRTGTDGIHWHNGRSFNQSTPGKFGDRQDQVYPYVVKGGLNGLDYVSMGSYEKQINNKYRNPNDNGSGTVAEARRFTMNYKSKDVYATQPTTNCVAAYAIMVFGSQQGGGAAILGADGALARETSVTAPFFKSLDQSIYVDGCFVNGNESTPNGDWQILSVPLNRTRINALGWNSNYGNSGGQNYAEVLLFSEALTADERRCCELYLAKKWGLLNTYVSDATPAPTVSLYGAGTIGLTGDATVEGSFDGTVSVAAGSTLVVTTNTPPPSESVVPSANRLAWFDPDLEGALMRNLDSDRPLCVNALYPRDANGVCVRTVAMSGYNSGADRRPWVNRSSRGQGVERNWLDFMNCYSGDTSGNTLRYQTDYSSAMTKSDPIGDVREGFMVLDTSRGGGTPIGTSVGMNTTRRANMGTNVNAPIWGQSSGIFSTMTTRLDNVVVDGTSAGFSGRPEVFEFSNGSAWDPAFFGSYQDGEGVNSGKGNTELIGETIFYSEALSDAEREEVTAYLAYKWFGKVLRGYTLPTRMTITGAGRVEVPGFATLPRFADTFTGTLVCSSRQLTFTLDPTVSCDHALDAVTLPVPCELASRTTITINSTTALRAGSYALLNGTVSYAGGTLPELVLTVENPADYKITLVNSAAGLALSVNSPGLQLILR